MAEYFEPGFKTLWGIEWFHTIEPLPNDSRSDTGLGLDVFFNNNIGKIALLYIPPEELNIPSGCFSNLLKIIHRKWLDNEPCIIFNDIKYKQYAIEWNSCSNTPFFKNDFELFIKQIL